MEDALFFKDSPVIDANELETNFENEVGIGKGSGLKPISEYLVDEELPEFVNHLGLNCYYDYVTNIKDTSTDDLKDLNKYVLIDGYVYSAADSFAAFCKDTGWPH